MYQVTNNNDIPCWTDYLQEWPSVPKESKYSGKYVVKLIYSGSSVKIEVLTVEE